MNEEILKKFLIGQKKLVIQSQILCFSKINIPKIIYSPEVICRYSVYATSKRDIPIFWGNNYWYYFLSLLSSFLFFYYLLGCSLASLWKTMEGKSTFLKLYFCPSLPPFLSFCFFFLCDLTEKIFFNFLAVFTKNTVLFLLFP